MDIEILLKTRNNSNNNKNIDNTNNTNTATICTVASDKITNLIFSVVLNYRPYDIVIITVVVVVVVIAINDKVRNSIDIKINNNSNINNNTNNKDDSRPTNYFSTSERGMSDKRPTPNNSDSNQSLVVTNGNRRQGCVVELDNYKYTIFVAGPPEEEDQSSKALPRTGSLTIVKKTLLSTSQQNLPIDTGTLSSPNYSQDDMGSSIGEQNFCSDEEFKRMHSLDLSYKLKKLVRELKTEDNRVPLDEIITNLQQAAEFIESFTEGSIGRTMLTEDDEFSRVDTDAVPPEVKDWLSMTFTQSLSVANAKRSSRAKFRSVANCIRAGIVVDKIYRRMTGPAAPQVPPKILQYYKRLDEWSFDILSFNEATDDHSLKMVTLEILQRYDLTSKFKMSTQSLESFLSRMEAGYGKHGNPYHNQVHAADVTQTVHSIIHSSGLSSWMTDLELLSTIISSAIHDYEHTGTTNTFHINTKSDMALLYNDRSVLENHHLSSTFRLLKDSEINPFNGLKNDDYKTFRNLVIEIVLATDMSIHFQQLKNMKASLSSPNEEVDKTKALALIVHCADISHAAKDWSLHHKWTEMLIEEFFRQGDRESELGLVISPLCDRKTTHVADSQIGFIGFIVDPSFQVMGDMIDHMLLCYSGSSADDVSGDEARKKDKTSRSKRAEKIARPWEQCLATNRQKWKERFNNGWICPLQAHPPGSVQEMSVQAET